mmetsp:Transcript_12994/g.12863  ORF Transcript_12994/g.12863 Transcript_12994/m.12863 type:complete len:121 (-) Transcript_12994:39-401(-)
MEKVSNNLITPETALDLNSGLEFDPSMYQKKPVVIKRSSEVVAGEQLAVKVGMEKGYTQKYLEKSNELESMIPEKRSSKKVRVIPAKSTFPANRMVNEEGKETYLEIESPIKTSRHSVNS